VLKFAGSLPPEHLANAAKVRSLLLGRLVTAAIGAAAQLRLPDLIAGGQGTVDQLAKATSTDPPGLYRLLRALTEIGVVEEQSPGTFGLTGLGHALRDDVPGTARPSALLASGEMGQAWDCLLYSVRTGRPAFENVFGTDLFGYLAERPERREVFYASQAADLEATLAGLASVDLGGYQTIVDVAGGDGALLAALLARHPQGRGILLEQESVVPAARQRMTETGLADRCEVVSGDMFTAVPGEGDLYLMRDILHDWPDERCVELLSVCRAAMPAGAMLMVIERVAGEPADQRTALMDLYMLSVLTGQERTVGQYRGLLDRAKLCLSAVRQLPAGAVILTAETS
jgi:hypothetical protein